MYVISSCVKMTLADQKLRSLSDCWNGVSAVQLRNHLQMLSGLIAASSMFLKAQAELLR